MKSRSYKQEDAGTRGSFAGINWFGMSELAPQIGLEPTTLRFYEGKCQEKYFPTELKPGENSAVAFSPPLARSGRCDVGRGVRPGTGEYVAIPSGHTQWFAPAEQGHRRPSGGRQTAAGFNYPAFPLSGTCCSERSGAVKGAPIGAAKRTLEGEDRSERMGKRESRMYGFQSDFLKREQARRIALCVCQPWFYLRLRAYSFFRLSEGA